MGSFTFRGSGFKYILFLIGLPLLFGFALHNKVKSAQIAQASPQAAYLAPAGQPGLLTAPALPPTEAAPAPTSTRTAARPTARPRTVEASPTPTLPEPVRPEEEGPLPHTSAAEPQPSPTDIQEAPALDPLDWKHWPVVPMVSEEMRVVYRRGLEQGNDPRHFSILGDCQSLPEVFMGIYDQDLELVSRLPGPWQETVAQFQGSFYRYSPTVKDGTTEGALLWGLWNDNEEGTCQTGESPLDCELRVHRPSIVLIHVGTHWEARNRHYLTIILNRILEHGAVPVLVTKADNRERDERVNENYAALSAEFGVPLWNFWFSVQNLPNQGMEPGSDMYLNQPGLETHRTGALQALDAVWRAVR
jgi:hypothetical protein